MQAPTIMDINRIYGGFNQAYCSAPECYNYLSITGFCDTDNGVHLDFNSEVARGYWELYRPHGEMLVCIAEGRYRQEYHQKILPLEDVISIRFVLSGNYQLSFSSGLDVNFSQLSASIMYTKRNGEFDLSINDGSHLSSVTLHLNPNFFDRSCEINQLQLPTSLDKDFHDRESTRKLLDIPLPPAIMNNVVDLLRMPYEGARRRLFTEAKSSELLCRLFQEIEGHVTVPLAFSYSNLGLRSKIFEARKVLTENYSHPPTIKELARHVGLNRSDLCTEFKRYYGTTIFEFALNVRMNKAREMLQDKTLSISQIANSVGYDYATNFTSAFKRQFGVLPKDLRNS